jgi:alkanesulfonate monooxygenase SsuD/methylene tetrahydromethanopterin reductase-like flavin-dependent oxidoreductase (luciferase family)
MGLEFGIWDHFEQQDPDAVPLTLQYEQRIELVVEAERYGFARYHVAEHHLTPLDMAPSPMVFLAAVARHTSRIRLGSMVLCLPLYHPVRLIQEICMLDHLSGGRFEPGVGRGVRDIEHEWFGLDPMQSRERYQETLDVVVQGLLQGKLDHRGRYFEYHDVPVHHRPAQTPLPPLWYAGNVLSAAAQGMNGLGRAEGRTVYETFRRAWEAGRASGNPLYQREPRVGSTRHLLVAETDAEARASARRAWRAYGEHFFATEVRVLGQRRDRDALGPGADPDRQIESGALLVGSPSTVRDKLLAYLDAVGPAHNYLVGAFQWGDLTHAEALRSLRLYATEVMPALAEGRLALGASAG